ncbi:MAG TPA: flagellar hook-length control protein FliK [Pirellulaceae bacterium]|nr:flagellar hook-length control protein FliK [Pirellulaceae bacterium]
MKTSEPASSIPPREPAQHNGAAPPPAGRPPFERLLRDTPAERKAQAAPPDAPLRHEPDPPIAQCGLPADDCQDDRIDEEERTTEQIAAPQAAALAAALAVDPVTLAVPIATIVGAETRAAELAEPVAAAEDANVGVSAERPAGMPAAGMPTADEAGLVPAAGMPSDAGGPGADELPAAEVEVSIPSEDQTQTKAAIEPLAAGDEVLLAGDAALEAEETPDQAATAVLDLQPRLAEQTSGDERRLPARPAIDPTEVPSSQAAEPRESAPALGHSSSIVTAGEPSSARGAPFHTPSLREAEAPRAAIPVEIDSPRLLHRVARAFHIAQQRGGELTLRLSPPELGSLRLELRVQDGVMTAKLEAETQVARAALIEQLPTLRERLGEQGIRIERFDVDLMQQRGQEPGARDQGPTWESGREGERERERPAMGRVEQVLPLSPSPPQPLADSATSLNVII